MNIYDKLSIAAFTDNIKQVTVGCIVYSFSKGILLLKRKPDDFLGNIYEIPGGKVEVDETIPCAIDRELKEETGYDLISIIRYVDFFDYLSAKNKKSRQFNFYIETDYSIDPILSEHVAHIWLPIKMISETSLVTNELKKTLIKFSDILRCDYYDKKE
ncbi:MAG: NUDIX domain-containing protein [Oscillospiraceae bacterium]|jgi:8-oxo-dGTP diphosphatase|nr:NUDIX domain-containing protein [Oscillospiraceae bacterium]